jgi:hypothetical protein
MGRNFPRIEHVLHCSIALCRGVASDTEDTETQRTQRETMKFAGRSDFVCTPLKASRSHQARGRARMRKSAPTGVTLTKRISSAS